MPAKVDATIQQLGAAFVQLPAHAGLSIGIVRNGQTRLYHFGTTRRGTQQLPTAQTVYEIGSLSKTFASLLLAQAVVEKRVRLTDDVRQYLDGDYPNLTYQGKPIQLLHLANTTAGLPNNFPGPAAFAGLPPDSIIPVSARLGARYTRQQFFQDLRRTTLSQPPGQTPAHSNVAGQLLGYVLENIYHQSYAELLKTRLEQPLGMHAGAGPVASELAATGYDDQGRAAPLLSAMPTLLAAGGLRYSPADLLRYVAYQLDEKQPAVALSHRATWGTAAQGVALNWLVSQTLDSHRRLRHSGGTFGCASYCDLYPEQRTGLVLLANESDAGTQDALKALSQQILVALDGEPAGWAALQVGLRQRGYGQVQALVQQVRRTHPELFLDEEFVNEWGYGLAGSGKLADALEVFKLNVALYPGSWNTYDSLAETYERLGNRPLAIENYQRSLALNAGNSNAADFLKKAGAHPAK
ncbi:serine hydrolase domain-containing protein [Hymenobacter ruricola]|nr:serine hydrolase domain-containing protein [Hymenobacter ruricola]